MKRLSYCRTTLLAALLATGTPLALAQSGSYSGGTTDTGTTRSTTESTRGMQSQDKTDADARTDMGPSTGSSGKPLPAGKGSETQPDSTRTQGAVEHESRTDMGPSSGAPGKPLPAGRGESGVSNPPSERSMPGGNDKDARTDMGPSTGSSGKPLPTPDSGGSQSGGSMQR
ncbi:MAG: hypothetical protein QHC78_13265 [Pigmentiphaga sp.]|uniref:hypothetical protein n=1 Tax=Pigmentiphaga sp. TaxID=1977564 RepID=UPI0029BB13FB|nr:hypothetical protein [Pigmentiphaga sp.]MDX3906648.1 hypothetical protein [Pigmentiphaga sp.]